MNKVIVITSGTSGIGRCIIKKIVKETQIEKIFINYGHNDNSVEELKMELPKEILKRLYFIKADMSNEQGLNTFLAEIKKNTERIDWLICNTGIGTYQKFSEYTIELWNYIMNTNVTIPTFLIKSLKDMFNENGKILFMSSYAGIMPYSSSVVYGVSKAAVCFLAKTLVKEFEDKKICINAIAPGFIETKWQTGRSDESRERINAKIACHRFGKPEEVGKLVYDVLTNDYINGTTIEITGGYNYF